MLSDFRFQGFEAGAKGGDLLAGVASRCSGRGSGGRGDDGLNEEDILPNGFDEVAEDIELVFVQPFGEEEGDNKGKGSLFIGGERIEAGHSLASSRQ